MREKIEADNVAFVGSKIEKTVLLLKKDTVSPESFSVSQLSFIHSFISS